jgi:hypothetical protein
MSRMPDEGNIYSAYAPQLLHHCFPGLLFLLLILRRGGPWFVGLLGRALPSGPNRDLWLRSMVRCRRPNSVQDRIVDGVNGAIGADYRRRVCLCLTRRQSNHL